MSGDVEAMAERLEDCAEDHWGGLAIEAAAMLRALQAENERLREALGEAREDNLWNAYHTGHVKDGRWTHMFMSDGEWLAQQCGFDPREADYPDNEIRAAIPEVARAALAGGTNDA